jgi:L-seryl-tRNA(Ser) seleniumtransferase
MVKALELYLNEDHDALAKEWSRRLNVVSDAIKRVPGVTTSFFEPDIANHVPTMKISWDMKRVNIAPRDASKALMDSKPSIVLGGSHDGLEMTAFMLKPGEDKIIAERLTAILKDHVAS